MQRVRHLRAPLDVVYGHPDQRQRRPLMGRRKVSVRRAIIDFPSPTPQATPCRLWQGPLSHGGYGVKHATSGSPVYAHRWAWALAHGPIPHRGVIMHLCDNRACFRVEHLRLGTHLTNSQDMVAKGRHGRLGKPGIRGADNRKAKLTDDIVREVRRRHATGEAIRALAREFNVTKTCIAYVVHGRTWTHVA